MHPGHFWFVGWVVRVVRMSLLFAHSGLVGLGRPGRPDVRTPRAFPLKGPNRWPAKINSVLSMSGTKDSKQYLIMHANGLKTYMHDNRNSQNKFFEKRLWRRLWLRGRLRWRGRWLENFLNVMDVFGRLGHLWHLLAVLGCFDGFAVIFVVMLLSGAIFTWGAIFEAEPSIYMCNQHVTCTPPHIWHLYIHTIS